MFGGVVRGNGHNVDATLGGGIKVQCIAWKIDYLSNKVSWIITKCNHLVTCATRSTRKGHWSEKECLNFVEDIEHYH
jgi:hypothetical protein